MKRLSDAAYNVYSQFGDDGIIEKIFEVIGIASSVCIEFGAWDGFHLSNTANLWTKGWRGILIESDTEKFSQLLKNTQPYDCCCINARVTHEGEGHLERILQKSEPTSQVDLLSIDIDGDDYHVFSSLDNLRPRVVCCEYNPTIPLHMELVPAPGNYFGCSALSLVKLAESKHYALVAMTETNCYFVLQEEATLFRDYETSLDALATQKHLTYLLTGYDGNFVLSRAPTYGYGCPSRQLFSGEYYHAPDVSRNGFDTPVGRGSRYSLPKRALRALRRRLP